MIEQVLVGAVALALAGWVARPLRSRMRTMIPVADDRLSDLVDAKQSVYRSLLDLELDRELGKIAPDDYQRLRQEGKKEALQILREIDGAGTSSEDELKLEEEIRAARARLHRE